MTDQRRIVQVAPWPDELEDLLRTFHYRPGWKVTLYERYDRGQGSIGTTLDITTHGYNSYHPDRGETYEVHHIWPVPPAAYNRQSWRRWLLEMCRLVEGHEACEFFAEGDGDDPSQWERPYAPNHGPGNDPYIVFEYSTDERRNTSFRGEVKSGEREGVT